MLRNKNKLLGINGIVISLIILIIFYKYIVRNSDYVE